MRHRLIVALVALGLLLSACRQAGGSAGPPVTATLRPNPYPSLRDLQADPAAALTMPEAERLGGRGEEGFAPALGQPRPAWVVAIFATQVSQDEVFAFYDRELRALDFAFIPNSAIPGTTERVVWSWCKPGLLYRLAIRNETSAVATGVSYRTIFDGRLIGRDWSPCRTK